MMKTKRLHTVFLLVILIVFWIFGSHASALTPKQIYQRISPGVVFIYASEGKSGSAGTGSIIREDGLVITNAHLFTRKNSSRLISNIWIYLKPIKVTGNPKKDLVRRFKGEILVPGKRDLVLEHPVIFGVQPDGCPGVPAPSCCDSFRPVVGGFLELEV